jgi:hypothetical protein
MVFEVWEALEQFLVDFLIDSMPSRLWAVVHVNGSHIPY